MKKSGLIIIIFIIALVLIVLGLKFLNIKGSSDCRDFLSGEDCWLCQNDEWVKHGNPSGPKPTELCGGQQIPIFTTIKGNTDVIKVKKPLSQAIVVSPLEIEGEARGVWYFEASFPIKLLDKKGQQIAMAIAQAQDDWMTENFVPFKAKIDFWVATDTEAILVLMKDNPSDLRQYDDQLEIPIHLQKSDTMVIKLFFNNSKLDPEFSCNKVFSVEREILKTSAVARAALEELFKGATEKEKSEGFFTSINPGVKIQKLTIENGIAKIDFNEQLEFQVGGSCRVSAIRAQITETLKQFPTVKEVIISINGRTEDILQP